MIYSLPLKIFYVIRKYSLSRKTFHVIHKINRLTLVQSFKEDGNPSDTCHDMLSGNGLTVIQGISYDSYV